MNFRSLVIFTILFLFVPFYGAFAAGERENTNNSSSGAFLTGVNDKVDVTSLDSISDTGARKDDKKTAKKNIVAKEDSTNDNSDGTFSQEEKEKVQQEINNYILDAYKIQGNKILKDIDTSLQKINTDADTRAQAYDHIQKTLEMRKKRLMAMDLSDNNKEILTAYLDYMIQSLQKRQADLRS